MKILAIDDDPDVLDVVSLAFDLHWRDSRVLTAPDGTQGLKAVEQQQPDIVILDLGLPDMDGFEVCRRIRGQYGMPVVILTVRDREQDIIKGLNLGAEDYVTKPFKHKDLVARVWAVAQRLQLLPADENPLTF